MIKIGCLSDIHGYIRFVTSLLSLSDAPEQIEKDYFSMSVLLNIVRYVDVTSKPVT